MFCAQLRPFVRSCTTRQHILPAPGGAGRGRGTAGGPDLIQDSGQIVMHPWTAELVTRNTGADLSGEHERALAMRFRRFEQQRGGYADLVDIPRHLAALGRYNEVGGIAAQAERVLPGTLAVVAYLAEVRPLIPAAERAWIQVAEQEFNGLLRAGDLGSATRRVCQIFCARGLLPVRFRMFIRCLFFALSDIRVPVLSGLFPEPDIPCSTRADAACPGYRAVLPIPGAAA